VRRRPQGHGRDLVAAGDEVGDARLVVLGGDLADPQLHPDPIAAVLGVLAAVQRDQAQLRPVCLVEQRPRAVLAAPLPPVGRAQFDVVGRHGVEGVGVAFVDRVEEAVRRQDGVLLAYGARHCHATGG
jgi:hypothetical protein